MQDPDREDRFDEHDRRQTERGRVTDVSAEVGEQTEQPPRVP